VAKDAELRRLYGIEWRLTGIASRRIGWIADPQGLDPAKLLTFSDSPADLASHFAPNLVSGATRQPSAAPMPQNAL
jgi:hypothetical protein